MDNPKVSVVMSVYNGEKHLKEAVDSILSQTFRDFEFIIVNDGSTDRTAEILESYHDPRISIVNNERNIGLTKSLNEGLKLAKGKYIARMDADDISLPERLQKQVEFLDAHEEIGVVGTAAFRVDERGKVLSLPAVFTESSVIKENLLLGNQFVHGSVMLRRECIYTVGPYREEFKYTQDYDLWLRLSEKYDVANIAEPLCKLRINMKALSVAKQAEQNMYARLARELSKQRARGGFDVLQNGQREEFEQIIRDLQSKNASQGKTEVAAAYDYVGRLFYEGSDYISAIRLLTRSLSAKPFRQDTINLILKCMIRLLIPGALIGVQSRLKRCAVSVMGKKPRNA